MTIKEVVKKMNLENQKIFTIKEMETIAKEAKCDLIDVMRYLRFGR